MFQNICQDIRSLHVHNLQRCLNEVEGKGFAVFLDVFIYLVLKERVAPQKIAENELFHQTAKRKV